MGKKKEIQLLRDLERTEETGYINHVCLYSVFSDAQTFGALQLFERWSPPASQFLETIKDSPESAPFIGKPTHPKPIPLNHLLYLSLTL